MTAHTPSIIREQLVHLRQEVTRVAAALAELSMAVAKEPGSPPRGDVTEQIEVPSGAVAWIIKARAQRTRYLNTDLFSDPAWDILLDLLRAEINHERVSVSSLCIAAKAPTTTALRYIKSMADRGLITRRADPRDARRVFVELAPETSKALRNYVVEMVQPLWPVR